MVFTGATNRSVSPPARDDPEVSQEHSHSALTPGTFYAHILMLRLVEMLFRLSYGVQDYVTYSTLSRSPPRHEACAHNIKIW